MNRNAVVTGAGSGVGQATAVRLAVEGWRVALVGRRVETLQDTLGLAGERAAQLVPLPCDIRDVAAVARMAERAASELGEAGTPGQRRRDERPTPGARGAFAPGLPGHDGHQSERRLLCVQAFLPAMRRRGSGTIVNIVSDAGKAASPKAGPAYVMSKFGLSGLTQSINAEERGRGVRACAIFPGDIDTPLLDKRPQPPGPECARMLRPEDVAECVMLCVNLPPHAIAEEIVIRPR